MSWRNIVVDETWAEKLKQRIEVVPFMQLTTVEIQDLVNPLTDIEDIKELLIDNMIATNKLFKLVKQIE